MNDDVRRVLHDLWVDAGRPATRDVADAAECSHATVANTLNGSTTPSVKLAERLAVALGGDVDSIRLIYGGGPYDRPPSVHDTLKEIIVELRAISEYLGGRAT